MIKLPNPQTKQWVQSNDSDIYGSIYTSFNIDLQENRGRLRIGKRLILNTSSADITMFCPVAFKIHNSKIYSLGGSTSSDGTAYILNSTELSATSFAVDASSNAPANIDSRYSDMETGTNGLLYATGSDKLYEANASGTWSATTRSLSASVAHGLASYGNRLYVIDVQSQVRSCDITTTMGALTSSGDANSLTFTNSAINNLTFIRSSASRLWIGSLNTRGGKGYVYSWDGIATQFTSAYRLQASGALACVIKEDVPYIVDSNANLLYWNGGTFKKIGSFNRKRGKQLYHANSTVNNRFIHPNGMTVAPNGNIRILINSVNEDSTSTAEDTIPSGVWEYSEENGLVHIGSLGLTKAGEAPIDFGQIRISQVGAISDLSSPSTSPSASANGTYMVGATMYIDAAILKHGVFYDDTNDTLQKAGYVVTSKIESQNVQDAWEKIYPSHRKLLNSTDKIAVRYRAEETDSVEASITWVTETTFTTTTDVSAYIGYEVEIIQGLGSGKSSKITNVTGSGTYTVTVADSFTNAIGTSKARFQYWITLKVIQNQNKTFEKISIEKTSNWIQFKIWCLFTGKNEIEGLLITNKSPASSTQL